jgi:acid-sensing ion channel, other
VSWNFFNNSKITWPLLRKLQLLALTKFCPRKLLQKRFSRYTNCNDCLEHLREIRIPPNEIFAECKFHNQLINCSASFKELVLDYALCYTFNGVEIFREDSENTHPPSHEWSIDGGYTPTAPLDVYPRRALRAGSLLGLSVMLKIHKSDIYYECYANPGFWVEYRMPSDCPQFLTNFFNIRLKSSTNFILKPKMIMTTDELRDLSTIERKCYFSSERRLKYFNQYTQSNCEIECLTDYLLRKCGCLQMLRDNGSDSSDHADICGPYHFKCFLYYKSKLFHLNFKPCGCLPACSSIIYETEVETTPLNMTHHVDYQEEYPVIVCNF